MEIVEIVDFMKLLKHGDNKLIIKYVDKLLKRAHTEGFDAGLDRGYNVGYKAALK